MYASIDLEEIQLRKTNFFILLHWDSSSYAKLLSCYTHLRIVYPSFVVPASEELPLYFG